MSIQSISRINYADIAQVFPGTELTSFQSSDLEFYFHGFKHREFLLSHTQDLPSHIFKNDFQSKRGHFHKKNSKTLAFLEITKDVKVIRNHVIYKL